MSVKQRLNAVRQHLTKEELYAKAVDPVISMNEERAKATFNIRELTHLLDGGEKSTLLKERFMQEFERDPLFKMDDIHDITKNELRERTMEKVQ
ncbi:hypothetical protein G6F35_011609 [Rhizopus arrhizus]|nr:hypothetical protein G6F35_011609 [Rhizopus arrhizus]